MSSNPKHVCWTEELPQKKKATLSDRFSRNALRDATTGCLVWQLRVHRSGYAYTTVNRIGTPVHRLSYLVFKGPIAPGLSVLHTCDNRRCIEPTHLFLGTTQQNAIDREMRNRGRWKNYTSAKTSHAKFKARALLAQEPKT